MNRNSVLWVAVIAAAFVAHPLRAQQSARPDEVAHRNDCRLAHQVLVHGQPANKYPWAVGVIGDCGAEGADALAHALRQQRGTSRRTAQADQLASTASMLVDAELFRAALDVASDASAGEAARIYAISILHLQVTGNVLPYEALVADPATEPLVVGLVTSWEPLLVRELPADAPQRALSALRGLMGEEAPAGPVRLAAGQAYYSIAAGLGQEP